jgi:hypothetical protein
MVTSDSNLQKVWKDALYGGLPGMGAMVAQVSTLMWLRTTINYQYRYGITTTVAFKKLYNDGGWKRFYRGYSAAIIQGPLSRFGDTAANSGVLTLLSNYSYTKDLPIIVKTGFASSAAAAFRILLMPIDTVKTMMQVEGRTGMQTLRQKIKDQGVRVLFHGSFASSAATFTGHYPWFATYNFLQETISIPKEKNDKMIRNAYIGFLSAATSDICSNSIRVVKTQKQTSVNKETYIEIVQSIIQKDGWLSLFGRGLKTKILTNGFQGMLFSVYWKMGEDYMKSKSS